MSADVQEGAGINVEEEEDEMEDGTNNGFGGRWGGHADCCSKE